MVIRFLHDPPLQTVIITEQKPKHFIISWRLSFNFKFYMLSDILYFHHCSLWQLSCQKKSLFYYKQHSLFLWHLKFCNDTLYKKYTATTTNQDIILYDIRSKQKPNSFFIANESLQYVLNWNRLNKSSENCESINWNYCTLIFNLSWIN